MRFEDVAADRRAPVDLLSTTDAMEWAKALVALMRETDWLPTDSDAEGWLVGWFANAMETAEKLSATRKVRASASATDRTDEIREYVLRARHRGWKVRLDFAEELTTGGDAYLARAIVADVSREIGSFA